MSLNDELASLFDTMADVSDLKGENPFKAVSFRKVARTLRDLSLDIRKCVDDSTLAEIEGIGEHSRRIIEQYVGTGRCPEAEQLIASVPPGLLPLLNIEGMGPRTVSLLWKQRQITCADDLVSAIAKGQLEGIKGLGEKKIAAIRQGLERISQSGKRTGIGEALSVARNLLEQLRSLPQVKRAEIAGSLRRRRETVGDVDLLCGVDDLADAPTITKAFTEFPGVARIIAQGAVKASVVSDTGLQIDVRVIPDEQFGAALMYFTGSKEHNVKVRSHALKQKLTLSEWGLYRLDEYENSAKKPGEAPPIKPVAAETEEQIYEKLGMQFVEPEIREDRGEVEAALAKRLPRLITLKNIRGDLHTHTTASDGHNTIAEMAEAAKALGYEYLAITDHSKSSVIANGLTVARLLEHIEAIRKAGDKVKGIALLAGAEVDILIDGRLDYEDDVLAELDIVIASPHVSLKQDAKKATARLLRAIENRYVNIIGHPTGRLINGREGLPLDFEPLLKAAAASGTAMEINSGYPRLDLDEHHSRLAIEAGVKLSINTDAHSTREFPAIRFGIGVARRAWATADDVINCLDTESLKKFLARKR